MNIKIHLFLIIFNWVFTKVRNKKVEKETNLEKLSFETENREAEFGLEATSPLNLEALEAKVNGDDEKLKRVFTEAEETCAVRLTQLAAMFVSRIHRSALSLFSQPNNE